MKSALHASFIAIMATAAFAAPAAPAWSIVPKDALGLSLLEGDAERVWLDVRAVGPAWSNARITALPSSRDGVRIVEQTLSFEARKAPGQGAPLQFRQEVAAAGRAGVVMRFSCVAGAGMDIIGIGPVLMPVGALSGGRIEITASNGVTSVPLPSSQRGELFGVKSAVLTLPDGSKIALGFAKPAKAHMDMGEIRLWAIAGKLAAGATNENTVTVVMPQPATFRTDNRIVNMREWFPYAGTQDFSPGSAIGMEDWLDKPAGRHGFVQTKDDRFVCEDGTPIKFWASNISWDDMAAPKDQADTWASKFAKYGVNLVRMHKFVNPDWAGIFDKQDGRKIVEDEAALFDYMHAALATRGVYYGWSPLFGYMLTPADKGRLAGYDEIMEASKDSGFFKGTTYGFANVAEELQDVYIQLTTLMLNRTNTTTGTRYADDPALAYVELHNEDDIFFFGIGDKVAKCPTYKKAISEKFCAWLKKRYASDADLKSAWGSLKKGESLADGSIYPFPGYWNPDGPAPKRAADSYLFLFECQNAFYNRYVKAIRATGYKGSIVGSCWQAADWLGHLYNIASDRRVGFIDRHNYFRGACPMLAAPGSALLSAGMQQVSDRPFGLSEWAGQHVFGAEAVPVLGIYGMGLQGWDLSAEFASSFWGIYPSQVRDVNHTCDNLMSIAQYPAVARTVLRGDVAQGAVVSTRRVSLKELAEGRAGFIEKFELVGGANQKSFAGSVPQQALAAGRVVLEYVDTPPTTPLQQAALAQYLDATQRIVRSTTGQLTWDYSGRGFFTINTPGTQGVIGFGGGTSHCLSDVTIEPATAFANIYVSAARPGETIASARTLLITTLARTASKGTLLDDLSMEPLKTSEQQPASKEVRLERALSNPDLIIEPVKVSITLRRAEPCTVTPLDHDGRTVAGAASLSVTPSSNGTQQFLLDGATSKTYYYVVEFIR